MTPHSVLNPFAESICRWIQHGIIRIDSYGYASKCNAQKQTARCWLSFLVVFCIITNMIEYVVCQFDIAQSLTKIPPKYIHDHMHPMFLPRNPGVRAPDGPRHCRVLSFPMLVRCGMMIPCIMFQGCLYIVKPCNIQKGRAVEQYFFQHFSI